MKQTVTESIFRDEFRGSQYEDNFSYDGLTALFAYLTNLEEETGTEEELDVCAFACSYTEYESLEEYNKDYEPRESIDEIENERTVIRIPNSEGFLISD